MSDANLKVGVKWNLNDHDPELSFYGNLGKKISLLQGITYQWVTLFMDLGATV